MTAIKVNDVFTNRGRSEAKFDATVLMVTDLPEDTFITYRTKRLSWGNLISTVETASKDSFLIYYKKKATFFETSKAYQYRDAWVKDIYYPQEIFTVSFPVTPSYREMARAVVIKSDGTRYMTMLTKGDFESMKEVPKR